MIGLGLLGASRIARKTLPVLKSVSGVTIAGVAASDFKRAQKFAAETGISTFPSYEDCLRSDDVQAIYVSVLNSGHYKLTKAALEAGKHVLCEKPLVLTRAEAEELFELASHHKLVLLEGLMYRHHPQIRRLNEIIASGALGRITSIHADFSFVLQTHGTARRTRAAGGGAIADVGCYIVDFANSCASYDRQYTVPEIRHLVIRKDAGVSASETVESSIQAFLEYENGVTASLNASIDTPSINRWEVRGEKGAIAALRFDPHGDGPAELYVLDEDSVARIERIDMSGGGLSQFRAQLENFRDAINGMHPAEVSPAQSIVNAAVLEALRARGL